MATNRISTALLAVLLICGTASFAQEIKLARNEKATEQAIATLLLTDIYKRAGLTAKVQPLPGARANAMTLSGEKDGEVARVHAYASRNVSLIKVEPAFYYLTTTAFARGDKGISIGNKNDLKRYKVGVVRGIAHAEAATEGLTNVQTVGDYDQMYQMLDAGRIDVAIDSGSNGPYVAKKLGLKSIRAVGELARLDLFHMLNPNKKELAPRISGVIKSLKNSGELVKLTKRHEDDFMMSGVEP